MNQTLTRWLACGACAAGSVVCAQEPAARLMPVRAVDAPPPAVVRAAPPAYQFQAPASVPAPGVQPRPQPQFQPVQQPQQPQPSLWGGVKSMFGGKPGDQPPPVQQPQAEAKPWWPTSEPPQAPPPKPPQGLYAGPPAYRWYGYGTPTAGANPYAPTGRYPQAADGWFAQTGATPGAFPVPVGGMPVTPREQPVVVHAFPQEPPRPVGTSPRPVIARTAAETIDPTPARTVVAETPRTPDRREPQTPIGVGVPVMPSGAGTPVSADPNGGGNEVSWQPAPQRVPIAASTPTSSLPVPVPPPEPATDWGPSTRPETPPPSVSVTRGQAPKETAPDLDTAIRSACFGRASRVGVTRPGPQRLHVTLVVPTEADARDAAAVVSRLPEVKAYSVTFEAVIGK